MNEQIMSRWTDREMDELIYSLLRPKALVIS